jgi:hypothetical protein
MAIPLRCPYTRAHRDSGSLIYYLQNMSSLQYQQWEGHTIL